MSRIVIVLTAVLLITAGTLLRDPWSLPTALGGTETVWLDDGQRCFWFKDDQQLICYRQIDTWFGRDIVPTTMTEVRGGVARTTSF